jgi:hypothetical protein
MVRSELGQVGVGPGAKVMRAGRRRKWKQVSRKKGGIGEHEAVTVRSESGQAMRAGRRRSRHKVVEIRGG